MIDIFKRRMIKTEYICTKCGKVRYSDFPIDMLKYFEIFCDEHERRKDND